MSPATIIKQRVPLSGLLSFLFLHSPPSSPDVNFPICLVSASPSPSARALSDPALHLKDQSSSRHRAGVQYILLQRHTLPGPPLLSAQGPAHWRCSQTCLLGFMFIMGARQHFDFTSGRKESCFCYTRTGMGVAQ